jgi:orotidine-5'-phosphate decarboxylase
MEAVAPEKRVIIALDVASLDEAKRLVEATGERAVVYKIGSELFTSCGPQAVELLTRYQKEVFLDLKFHDIPNTVSRAVTAAATLGVKMLNVHASGGAEMMRAAVEAARGRPDGERPKVLAVTVLTSIDAPILAEDVGCRRSVEDQVVHLARLAEGSGMDGVVASAKEVALLRPRVGSEFLIVTPGIRPRWAARGDQKRVTTPAEAFRTGADYIVIGRPVTASDNPKEALDRILAEISEIIGDETP